MPFNHVKTDSAQPDSSTTVPADARAGEPLPRAHGLDVLRGLAILAMVLAGSIPWAILPRWMYHLQDPPHGSPAVPGISWVDLVFPFFLFAMGAAIPIALGRRLAAGKPPWKLTLGIWQRGFFLGFFAILHQHVMPHVIAPPDTRDATFALGEWSTTVERGALWASIFAFLMMFGIFMTPRPGWSRRVTWTVRGVGWAGTVLLLCLLTYPVESRPGFSLYRSNIILVVLANMAVFGSLAWLIARGRPLPLLGVMAFMLAARLGAQEPGWVKTLWHWSPALWIYHFRYLQYLLVVIPGLIAGNLLWAWMKDPRIDDNRAGRGPWSWAALAVLCFGSALAILIGLQERWLWQTNLAAAVFGLAGWWLTRCPVNGMENFLRNLFSWGMFWLVLGLVFEPYEGGVRKTAATVSYYLISAGLASILMVGFIVVIDVLKRGKWLRLLIDNGQNPMIAYVGSGLFIVPVLTLTGLHGRLQQWLPGAGWGMARALLLTLLLALMVRQLTRWKIYWRT